MNKTSGQAGTTPQEEKIEIIATDLIGSVLAALEKKLIQFIEDFQPPVPDVPTGKKEKKLSPSEQVEQKRVEDINAKNLETFRKSREVRNAG